MAKLGGVGVVTKRGPVRFWLDPHLAKDFSAYCKANNLQIGEQLEQFMEGELVKAGLYAPAGIQFVQAPKVIAREGRMEVVEYPPTHEKNTLRGTPRWKCRCGVRYATESELKHHERLGYRPHCKQCQRAMELLVD